MENKKYARSPDMIFRLVGQEAILVPIGRSIVDLKSLFNLNEVGAFLWQQLTKPLSRDELLESILREYQVPEKQASADLDQFIAHLLEENCVVEV